MSTEVITATLRLTVKDLEVPIVELSPIFRARLVLVGVLVLSVPMLASLQTNAGQPWPHMLPQILFSALFVAFLYLAPRRAAHKILRALTQSGDGDISYRFDEDGVTIRAAGSTTTFAYRTLVKAREGSTAFLLYPHNPLVANIIPKRAFAADDLPRVRAYVTAHAPLKSLRGLGLRVFGLWVVLIFVFIVIWQFLNASAPR
jgi:hypothetical protein